MKNDKTLKGITVAELLLQIQDAQNKIQEAQKQISETLEAIQVLQAQEPERQETQQVEEVKQVEEPKVEEPKQEAQQVEEPKKLSPSEYYQKYLSIWDANLEGRSDQLCQMAKKLDDLEDKAADLGCPMDYDWHHRANHLRGLADEFGKLDSYILDLINQEDFENLEKQFEFIESGRFLNYWLAFDENMERANNQVHEYEEAIKAREKFLNLRK